MASVEDREGLRATVDAYLAAPEAHSRIDVFHGLGSASRWRRCSSSSARRSSDLKRLADWMADVLGAGGQPTEPSI